MAPTDPRIGPPGTAGDNSTQKDFLGVVVDSYGIAALLIKIRMVSSL